MHLIVGKAQIEFLGAPIPFRGKPINRDPEAEEIQQGAVSKFRVTTTDELNFVFGIVTWPAADPEVGPIEFIEGLEKYRRLEDAGRASILLHKNLWALQLRAMKIAAKPYYTLNGVSLDELTDMLGSDAATLLKKYGVLDIKTRAELLGDVSSHKNKLILTCMAGDTKAVAVFFCLTRVIPIMFDFGLPEFAD